MKEGSWWCAHPVVVVIDVEALVGVDVDVLLVLGLLRGRPHKAPHWQVVHEQLIPAAHKVSSFPELVHVMIIACGAQ